MNLRRSRPRKDYILGWDVESSILERTKGRKSFRLLRGCIRGHRFLIPKAREDAAAVYRQILHLRGGVHQEAASLRSGHRWQALIQEAEGLESLAGRVHNHTQRLYR